MIWPRHMVKPLGIKDWTRMEIYFLLSGQTNSGYSGRGLTRLERYSGFPQVAGAGDGGGGGEARGGPHQVRGEGAG